MNFDRLQDLPIWKIWAQRILVSFVASEALVAAIQWSLFGVVTWDYLLTGGITSIVVGSALSGYAIKFLAETKRLGYELARSEEQMRLRTNAKAAEVAGTLEALRRSESQLRNILDNSATVVFLKDLQGRYLLINRRYEELFHVGRDAVVGKTDHDIFAAEFAEKFQEADRRALEAGRPIEAEELVPHDEGLHSYISIKFPLTGEDGKPYAVCGIATDITERKRAAEALRIGEERLRLAMEATQQGWFDLNVQTGEVTASPEFVRIVGDDAAHSRMSFQTWIDSIHREDRDAVLRVFNECLKTGEARQMEYRMLARTGEWKWIRSAGKIVALDARGAPLRMTGTHADVTERRRAEEALRSTLERTRRQQAALAKVAVLPSAAEGDIGAMARAVTELGAETAGAGRVALWLFEPDGERLRCVDLYENALRHHSAGTVRRREEYGNEVDAFRSANYVDAHEAMTDPRTSAYAEGYLRPLGITSLLDAAVRTRGRVRGFLCFEHVRRPHRWEPDEIAFACQLADQIAQAMLNRERRRAEEAMRTADKRYRSLFQAASDCILVIDRDGKLLDINDTGSRTLGYTRDELLGESFSRVLDARLLLRMYPRPADLLVERRTVRGEQEVRSKRGAARHVEFVASPMADGNVLAVVRDVTDRKRLEEARMRSQTLESLGTLAGGIAHDFNNILLAINGNATLALEDMGEDHPARESIAEITRAGQRAADLVRRILAFSRPQGERREVLALRPVLEEAIKLLRPALPAAIEFRMQYCEEPLLAAADATQVHEAVVNLATNAAHAIGDQPGWIEFRLEPAEVDKELADRVAGLLPGGYALLSVTDSGCGMDRATQRRIFDAFYTTKPVGQGTGLGLSMVHGIMKGHGGAIEVESAPGKGSSFRLYFPVAEAPAREEAGKQVPAPALAEGKRVLYVDDEEALVYLMRRVLGRKGHKVSGFTSARAALDEFRARPLEYDVVVTDLSMPGMSGFDFANEVRAIRGDVPVLMVTGYARLEDEDRARAAGIRRVIPKPNTVDELGAIFDQLFRNGDGPGWKPPG